MPNGYNCESADEANGPSQVLEGKDLVGVEDRVVYAPPSERVALPPAAPPPAADAKASDGRGSPADGTTPATMQLVVPARASPGQPLQVQTPDGRLLLFVILAGAVEGTALRLQVPA